MTVRITKMRNAGGGKELEPRTPPGTVDVPVR